MNRGEKRKDREREKIEKQGEGGGAVSRSGCPDTVSAAEFITCVIRLSLCRCINVECECPVRRLTGYVWTQLPCCSGTVSVVNVRTCLTPSLSLFSCRMSVSVCWDTFPHLLSCYRADEGGEPGRKTQREGRSRSLGQGVLTLLVLLIL